MSKYGTLKDNEENKIYPNAYYKIGDIFITTNEENPTNRFGGTWEKLPEETFLMTASSKYVVKSTGGENEVTLTVDEIPAHGHNLFRGFDGPNKIFVPTGTVKNATWNTYQDQSASSMSSAGGGQPHNNMPKFYAVYIWIRVA